MSNYDKIAWLPLCGGLTGVGLVLSYLAMRRRGIGSGLRGAAWSLLPVAAYLTGAIEMFWKMGVAIGDFATGFVFSPKVWSGIAVAGFSALLFVASGPLRRRRVKRGSQTKEAEPAAGPAGTLAAARTGSQLTTRTDTRTAAVPVKARKGKSDDDDDLGDVADILRRHGIT
jgi:membrane protein implicated in regulation of membrane protease activity